MFSHVVSREYNPVDSGTTPSLSRIDETLSPLNNTLPFVGSSTPAISLNKVVFPAPFPPTKPITWPE